MTSTKRCFLTPPDAQPCIWMSAGLLSYQLCNQVFDCDACPVDAAMRGGLPRRNATDEGVSGRPASIAIREMPQEGHGYSRNHWWMRKMGQNQVRLGVESGLAQSLLAAKGVVFPSPHQRVSRGQACIWVVMDGGTLALESPLNGAIWSINRGLIDKPHLLWLQPFDDGWLCEVETEDADAEISAMMAADEARPMYAADRTRFSAALVSATKGKRAGAGAAPGDGGELTKGFAEILGPMRYIALLRQHFGWIKK
jgi:glycine cleavage system H protein